MNTPRARELLLEPPGVGRAEREEAGETVDRDVAVPREHGRGQVEGVDGVGEHAQLVLVDGAQEGRLQPVGFEELEHAAGPVVAGGVVGAAGEAGRRRTERDGVGLVVAREVVELGEPAGDDGAGVVAVRGDAQEGVALAELQVLVAAAGDPRPVQPELVDRERQGAEGVVGVDEQVGAVALAGRDECVEVGHDAAVGEQDRRDADEGRAVVHLGGHPLGEGAQRLDGDPDHLEAHLGQAVGLPAQRVELAGGDDQPGPRRQVEARQELDDQVVGGGPEGDLAVGVAEQAPVAGADHVGRLVGPGPLPVDLGRGGREALDEPVEGDVGPRLVGVARQEEPLGDPEARVVRRQGVGRPGEVVEPHRPGHYSWLRTDHSAGKTGRKSVERR